jgi:hypothetical protein
VWLRRDYHEPPPAAPDHVVDSLLDVVPLVNPFATVEEVSRR